VSCTFIERNQYTCYKVGVLRLVLCMFCIAEKGTSTCHQEWPKANLVFCLLKQFQIADVNMFYSGWEMMHLLNYRLCGDVNMFMRHKWLFNSIIINNGRTWSDIRGRRPLSNRPTFKTHCTAMRHRYQYSTSPYKMGPHPLVILDDDDFFLVAVSILLGMLGSSSSPTSWPSTAIPTSPEAVLP
jgi:hypothetical protein